MKKEEKIYFHIRSSCSSSRKARNFLDENNIDYEEVHFAKNKLSKEEIRNILERTDEEFDEVLKKNKKDKELIMVLKEIQRCKSRGNDEELMEILTKQLIDILASNQLLFKTPIIIQGDKFLVGWNEDDIRMFLPKELKRKIREEIYQMLAV